jgi:hypothetical protein
MEPKYEFDKTGPEKAPDFKSEVDAIISRPLNPEIIDCYADGALDDFVDVVGRVTETYKRRNPKKQFESGMEAEIAAFDHFGLGDIIQTLDDITDRAQKIWEDICNIERRISKIETSDFVITPTVCVNGPNIQEHDGSFVEKGTVPKLKTIMFVLKNEFGVDINDEAQFKPHQGEVDKDSIRKHPYFSLELPSLSRSILVCDEVGNDTFVFDNEVLLHRGLGNGDLVKITKPELKKITDYHPDFCRAVQYSKDNFVSDIIDAIDNPSTTRLDAQEKPRSIRDEGVGEYLRFPKVPEGYFSKYHLAKLWGVGELSFQKVVDEYREKLEEMDKIEKYRFVPMPTYGFSPNHQVFIHNILKSKGLVLNEPPEFDKSAAEMSKDPDWKGASAKTIRKTALGEEWREDLEDLGEIKERQFVSNSTEAFIPDHRALAYAILESEGYFNIATDDIMTMRQMKKVLDADPKTINKAIAEHPDEVGEIIKYNFGTGSPRYGYTSAQREIIKPYVDEMKRKSNS